MEGAVALLFTICYPGTVLIAFLVGFVVLLILGGAIFIANAGILFCEDGRMMKILVGGYFSLYLVAAILIKIAVPPVGGNAVNVASVGQPWHQVFDGLNVGGDIPGLVKTVFGAEGP